MADKELFYWLVQSEVVPLDCAVLMVWAVVVPLPMLSQEV